MKIIALAVITLLAVTTATPAAPSGSPSDGSAPAPAPAAAPGADAPAPAPAAAPDADAPAPAPAAAPDSTPSGAPAPAPVTAPAGAPGAATGTAANKNPNNVPPQPSAGTAAAPARNGNAAPTPFPAGSPGATEKKGVKFCKFCCVNAQKGTWTPGPGRKSGCADRAGANAVYTGCCDRLGDCCPVSIGLPSNLYQCCDSSKKEVCGGTIYQPTCTIDFTIPDPKPEEESKATPSPVGAPAAIASPSGSPAPAPSPSFDSACGKNDQDLVTGQKLPGTCFRRCDVRGNGCGRTQQPYYTTTQPYYTQPTYQPTYQQTYQPNYYTGFRQFNNVAYGMSYGVNRLLPSAVPSFNNVYYQPQVRAQIAQPTTSSACDQESCSCDKGCESRGDCCFDYCAFCVV